MPLPAAATSLDDGLVEIRTTFARREQAVACAERIVTKRLAACVQIDGPITSLYRWQGAMETAEEFRCTCKTSRAGAAACTAAILAMHDYQTPEVIVTEVRASAAYADWVRAGVGSEPMTEESHEATERP